MHMYVYIHVYVWNRSPAQVGCMRQVLGPGALGRPSGIGWCGRWEGGSGWGTHVNPWLIHFNVWQKPLQCCKVISLQLIKINEKKKRKSESCVRLFGTPGTIQSMEFSRPEYWSGEAFPGKLSNPGIYPRSPTLQVDSLPAESPGKPKSTELGSLSLLQWIFPTQELNQRLLHCRWILYQPHWKAILNYSLSQYCLICSLPWMSEVGRNLLLKSFYMTMDLYSEYIKNS